MAKVTEYATFEAVTKGWPRSGFDLRFTTLKVAPRPYIGEPEVSA